MQCRRCVKYSGLTKSLLSLMNDLRKIDVLPALPRTRLQMLHRMVLDIDYPVSTKIVQQFLNSTTMLRHCGLDVKNGDG